MNLSFNTLFYIGAAITIVILVLMLRSEKAQNLVLLQENVFLEQTLKDEQTKAQKAISEANNRIAEYELNKTKYETTIASRVNEIETITKTEEVRIITELQKDSSLENQLKLIEGILHDFSSKK